MIQNLKKNKIISQLIYWIKKKQLEERDQAVYSLHPIIRIDKYKVIYFPIPKVATSTLKYISAKLLELENIDSLELEDIHEFIFPSVERKNLHKYQDYYKFGFVRNPWERLFSCYKSKIKVDPNYNHPDYQDGISKRFVRYNLFRAGMSFEEFVKAISQIPDPDSDFHFKSQYIFFTNNKGEEVVNFIGRYESLQEDWKKVRDASNLPAIELPHLNKESSKHYSEYYTPETIDIVSARYAEDINKFGYKFEFKPN
ncbi:sulfotransferase family protein [Dapis sp. BLCC M126]